MYKSTNGGMTFDKIMKGLPAGDIGGMGIAISPVNPDVLYLIIEAQGECRRLLQDSEQGRLMGEDELIPCQRTVLQQDHL
ncbi:MAG: hypothetical protein MZV63_27405 [Marinilabiliales bacterium]|nr:hypothetical protein [Marinilabiliales bacterium]